MAKTLQQILGHVYLSGLVEEIKTGIPDVLPGAFWTTKSRTLKDQGRYSRYSGTRKTAKRAQYGSSSRRRELSSVGSFDVKLLHFFEHIQLNVTDYMSLRNYTDYGVQDRGLAEIERQQLQFRTLFDNMRVAAVMSMLANGAIYFDSDGNLLPTSSGASLTVDYGVSANNKNQLNGLISASWATATTDIPSQLRAMRLRVLQATGHELKYLFYGRNIPSYLTQNNYVKDYLARHPDKRDEFLSSNEIPNGLFDFTWVPVYKGFFEDQNGTVRTFFGDDAVTATPDIGMDVYEYMEGTYPVPTSFQPAAGLAQAMGTFEERLGIFSYAVPIANPVTAELHCGDTFLPIWKVPDAILIADTTP
jgi:hypothetical protein